MSSSGVLGALYGLHRGTHRGVATSETGEEAWPPSPRGLIEASANIVGKAKEEAVNMCAAVFLYVLRYGEQCRRVDGRPGESCSSRSVVVRPVPEQERLRG
jgi:hypothetical protein